MNNLLVFSAISIASLGAFAAGNPFVIIGQQKTNGIVAIANGMTGGQAVPSGLGGEDTLKLETRLQSSSPFNYGTSLSENLLGPRTFSSVDAYQNYRFARQRALDAEKVAGDSDLAMANSKEIEYQKADLLKLHEYLKLPDSQSKYQSVLKAMEQVRDDRTNIEINKMHGYYYLSVLQSLNSPEQRLKNLKFYRENSKHFPVDQVKAGVQYNPETMELGWDFQFGVQIIPTGNDTFGNGDTFYIQSGTRVAVIPDEVVRGTYWANPGKLKVRVIVLDESSGILPDPGLPFTAAKRGTITFVSIATLAKLGQKYGLR